MLTHAERSKLARNASPCTARDMTFGGRCMACGWVSPSFQSRRTDLPDPFNGYRIHTTGRKP